MVKGYGLVFEILFLFKIFKFFEYVVVGLDGVNGGCNFLFFFENVK